MSQHEKESLPRGFIEFAGMPLEVRTVMSALKQRFNVSSDIGVFCRAYAFHHNGASAQAYVARLRMRKDLKEYRESLKPAHYVLHTYLVTIEMYRRADRKEALRAAA